MDPQAFFGRIVDLYHTTTKLGAEPPSDGPVIFVANHPNGLIDPIVVSNVVKRRLLFLAKAPLFKIPIVGQMASAGGAIPVYRRIDGDDTARNDQMFRAVHTALAKGGALCLFPEGISHNEPDLQRLKTGAARMALGAEAENGFSLGVKIVPVGLTYRSKTQFQSSVAAEIGESIEIKDLRELYKSDSWQAVEQLTKRIAAGIKAVTLNLQEWEDLHLLELAEAILPNDGEHKVQRLKSFAAAGVALDKMDPKRLNRLREQLRVFATRLESYGLTVHQLNAAYDPKAVLIFVGRNLVAILIGFPVTILALCAYAVPLLLVKITTRMGSTPDDIFSTIKLLAALVFFPLWQVFLTVLIFQFTGWAWALSSLVFLPMAAFYMHFFFRRRRQALREAMVFLTMPLQGRKRRLMIREKQRLTFELSIWAEAINQAGHPSGEETNPTEEKSDGPFQNLKEPK